MNVSTEAVKLGLIKTVSVPNYSTHEMIGMYDCLQKHGIQTASNRVKYFLPHRSLETSGYMIECCKCAVPLLGCSLFMNFYFRL